MIDLDARDGEALRLERLAQLRGVLAERLGGLLAGRLNAGDDFRWLDGDGKPKAAEVFWRHLQRDAAVALAEGGGEAAERLGGDGVLGLEGTFGQRGSVGRGLDAPSARASASERVGHARDARGRSGAGRA